MANKNAPISEFYEEDMSNLFMFFSNGKKEFWRFDKIKEMGINKCILFFPRDFKKLTKIYKKCELIYEFKSASSISPVYLYDNKVLIAMCPLGGPASVNLMEELIYVGIKYFVGVGSCGLIQKLNLNIDQYFIPDRAIRDEGCSYHYLPASRYVETNEDLNAALAKALDNNSELYLCGTVWSTDAIYRETQGRIKARINDGAIAVEMETASLAAVAKAKDVHYSCMLYFSDYNDSKEWKTRIYDKFQLREELIKYSVEALTKYVE